LRRRPLAFLALIVLATILQVARPVLAEDGVAGNETAQGETTEAEAAPAPDEGVLAKGATGGTDLAAAPDPGTETGTETEPDADEAPKTRGLPKLSETGGAGQEVIIIPITGTIDLGLAPFVARVLEEHPDAAAVILDVDTFGGRVDAAVKIRDAVLDADVPTIAYVHPRAISAGALISYACDHLVFASGGSMGAATPITIGADGGAESVDEKMTSYMRAEMRSTAEANDRDGDLAEAMVDRTIVIDGVVDDTKLLTATTETAVRIGLADSVQDSLGEVLTELGLEKAERITSEASWAEEISRILTDPTVSGLLMSIGMLGLMIELYSPGFGLPGAVGLSCLGAFFGGHLIADLAGAEELVLLVMGLVALGVEVFVIPGFGIVGVIGIGFIVAALSLSMVGMPLDVSWQLGFLTDAIRNVLVSIAGAIVAMALLIKFLPTRALPNWLILRTQLGDKPPQPPPTGADFQSAPDRSDLVGVQGVAETDLRLSGKGRLQGRIVDVVSEHEYIKKGAAIVVIAVEGVRVVVTTTPDEV
jgi:membrane-bound serine protease (ClpP class)